MKRRRRFDWPPLLISGLIALIGGELAAACTCPGQTATVSGQTSCFEIVRQSGGSWATADKKCAALNGFIAHLDSQSLISTLQSYISQNYQQKLMAGGVVGNSQFDLIAMMCPNNTFLSLMNTTVASSIITGNSSEGNSCLFLQNSDYKLHYASCSSSADVLCEIPMTSSELCGVMMQCSSSSSPTTRRSSLVSGATTRRTGSSNPAAVVSSQRSGTTGSANSSRPTVRVSASVTVRQSTASVAANQPKTSSKPTAKSSSSSNSTSNSNPNSPTSSKSASGITSKPSNGSSTKPPNSNSTANSTPHGNSTGITSSATGRAANSSATTAKAANSTTPPLMLMNAMGNLSDPESDLNSTMAPFDNSSAPSVEPFSSDYPDSDTNGSSSSQCGSGYTKLGKWCFPWWGWVLVGVLAFIALLALVICCTYCCITRRKRRAYIAVINRAKTVPPTASSSTISAATVTSTTAAVGVATAGAAHQTPVATTSIYERNVQTEMVAPMPHSAMPPPPMPAAATLDSHNPPSTYL